MTDQGIVEAWNAGAAKAGAHFATEIAALRAEVGELNKDLDSAANEIESYRTRAAQAERDRDVARLQRDALTISLARVRGILLNDGRGWAGRERTMLDEIERALLAPPEGE